MPQQADRTVTIPSGSTSISFGTGQANRGSFQLPTMTGTTITINVSNDGVSFPEKCPVEGNETNPITTQTNGTYSFPVKAFNFRYLQIVSGSTETAARNIGLFTRD